MSRETSFRSEIVCAPTKEQHDYFVSITGRPLTQDPMTVRSAGLPDGDPVSLVDVYLHEMRRGNTTPSTAKEIR